MRVEHPSQLARPPKHATLPDLSAPTRGRKIALLATETRKPLLPHQQYIADVATEMNPPGSPFLFRRRIVVVSLPRQTGKTTLQRPVVLERCLSRPRTRVFMTAQLGKYASARWADLVDDFTVSPLIASWVRVLRGKGSESCTFPNGSAISPFPPEKDALHGETPPLVTIDEGWAFSQDQGDDLMRAIRPAQQTLWDRQVWVFSAAGSPESAWWDSLCAAGRASLTDPGSDMAYFDWSLPDDADPYDEDAWQFHPGLDGLITLETLREESNPERNSPSDWLRGFMNRPTKVRTNQVIDLAVWDALAAAQVVPAPERVVLGFDSAVDLSESSVWAAWTDGQTLDLHVFEHHPGADWLADCLTRAHRAGYVTIATQERGPARGIADALRSTGVPVVGVNDTDTATAWGEIKAKVQYGRLRHDGEPALRDALTTTAERRVGDVRTLDREASSGPICPVTSATAAAWVAMHDPTPQIF
ncbi:MAG: phage terminase family protein [Cellulomonas sp.]|nr:phage terminase family protein [Cellulomonas sp.]